MRSTRRTKRHSGLRLLGLPRIVSMITAGLTHWQSGQPLTVQNGQAVLAVAGKTIDIDCREPA